MGVNVNKLFFLFFPIQFSDEFIFLRSGDFFLIESENFYCFFSTLHIGDVVYFIYRYKEIEKQD